LETISLLDLVNYVFGFLNFWDLGFLGIFGFHSSQSFPGHVGNVLLALYIGSGDCLTFGSGYLCFWDLGDLDFLDLGIFGF